MTLSREGRQCIDNLNALLEIITAKANAGSVADAYAVSTELRAIAEATRYLANAFASVGSYRAAITQ